MKRISIFLLALLALTAAACDPVSPDKESEEKLSGITYQLNV